MPRLPELPPELTDRIDDLLAEELPRGYTSQLEEAWDLLPEPRTHWSFYPQSIAKSACDHAVEVEDWALADRWLARGRQAYAATGGTGADHDGPMDHWEARIKVARGDADAYEYCGRMLDKHGPRFFAGPQDDEVRRFLAAAEETHQ